MSSITQKSKFEPKSDSESSSDSEINSDLDSSSESEIEFEIESKSKISKQSIVIIDKGHIKTPKALKLAHLNQKNRLEKQKKKHSSKENEFTNDFTNDFTNKDFFDAKIIFDDEKITEFLKINIRVHQRNARKFITSVAGIPSNRFDDIIKVEKLMFKLKNAISARATIKNKDSEPVIEMAGNKIELIIPIICAFVPCNTSDIIVHGMSMN
jgi:translation initiation factor 1 (eIF-1/SUI1)